MKTRAQKRNEAYLIDRLLQTGAFKTTLCLDYIYIANGINYLTAVCSPRIFRRAGLCAVEYDLLLTVIKEPSAGEEALEKSLKCEGGVIGLPQSTPPAHTMDRMIFDDRLSDWLINRITAELQKYTLGVHEALALVTGQDDRFISSLKSVYQSRFDDVIVNPLTETAKHTPLDDRYA